MKQKNKVFLLIIALFSLSITSVMAGNCITMSQDLTMSVNCAQYGDIAFEFSLVPYKNSDIETQSDLFWKLDSFF